MNVFTRIDDSLALVRLPNGVFKQVEMFSRGDSVYVAHGSGYLRVAPRCGETEPFPTSHPKVKVVEFEAPGVVVSGHRLTYVGTLKMAA